MGLLQLHQSVQAKDVFIAKIMDVSCVKVDIARSVQIQIALERLGDHTRTLIHNNKVEAVMEEIKVNNHNVLVKDVYTAKVINVSCAKVDIVRSVQIRNAQKHLEDHTKIHIKCNQDNKVVDKESAQAKDVFTAKITVVSCVKMDSVKNAQALHAPKPLEDITKILINNKDTNKGNKATNKVNKDKDSVLAKAAFIVNKIDVSCVKKENADNVLVLNAQKLLEDIMQTKINNKVVNKDSRVLDNAQVKDV